MNRLKAFAGPVVTIAITLTIQTETLASTTELASPVQQTTLVELYTFEGCSSCPPADR